MAGEEKSIDSMAGMVIAILAILYTVVVNLMELFRKKKHPSTKSARDPVNDFLESLKKAEQRSQKEQVDEEDEEIEDDEKGDYVQETRSNTVPVHKGAASWKLPEEKFVLHSAIEDLREKTRIDDRKLTIDLNAPEELVSRMVMRPATAAPKVGTVQPKSPIQLFLGRLPNKKALIIASEIIQPPIGFRRRER